MKYGIILISLAALLALGATCLPLLDLNSDDIPDPGTLLAISILKPAADRSVPLGATVEIEWTVANLTGEQAVTTVFLRSLTDLSETIVVGGLIVTQTGGTQSVAWNTGDFGGGTFVPAVRIEAGARTEEAFANAEILVDTAPGFAFTEPFVDTTLGEDIDPNDPNMADDIPTITIRWSASDPDGDAEVMIGIDPDLDHESGNETIIAESTISVSSDFDSIDWDGTDSSGDEIEGGTYNLFAQLNDGVNAELFVDGLARVILPIDPNMPMFSLEVVQPEDDVEFLTSADPLTIEVTLDESDDVLIDLKVDTDDNHKNGNETTILTQRLIDKDTNEDSFDWDGTDSDGASVPDAIYRVFMAVNRGSGSPTLVQADGLIFRRSAAEKPLIALLDPGSDQEVNPGAFVTITWRDDDPSETATVRLTLDDDPNPAEMTETDNPELEILMGRGADGDDVQDTFAFQVPSLVDLPPGRYHVFAYIGRPGMGDEHNSVAAAVIEVIDPEATP